MRFTPAQAATIKAYYQANMSTLSDDQARDAFNALASPAYNVWRSDMTRPEIYAGANWDWTLYKAQAVSEQNTWREMFSVETADKMTCNMGALNNRVGVSKIFTGSAALNAMRDHVFASSKRSATLAEKLLAVAVVAPPANSGNDTGQPRGSLANADVLGWEGPLTTQDVIDALSS